MHLNTYTHTPVHPHTHTHYNQLRALAAWGALIWIAHKQINKYNKILKGIAEGYRQRQRERGGERENRNDSESNGILCLYIVYIACGIKISISCTKRNWKQANNVTDTTVEFPTHSFERIGRKNWKIFGSLPKYFQIDFNTNTNN